MLLEGENNFYTLKDAVIPLFELDPLHSATDQRL